MRKAESTLRLGLLSGVATWVVVTGAALYIACANGNYSSVLPFAALLALANCAAMIYVSGRERNSTPAVLIVHWLQLASALAMGWLLPVSFLPIYTIIWIAMAVSFYALRTCVLMLAALLAGWYLIERFVWEDQNVILSVMLYGSFHLFAMLSAHIANMAEAARTETEALNRELLATQHLLSEASRQAERTRIARDLHDLLGHHLTALSLNLQIAERQSDGEVRSKIEECRSLARLLLSDVRDAVSRLRDDDALDIRGALSLLGANLPQLDVTLEMEESVIINDLDAAESLLRCAQEALTNSLRHSGATESRIRVWQNDGKIHMAVTDNGRVQGSIREGNGIAGMRERLAQHRGSLDLDIVDDALKIRVSIPVLAG